MTLAEVLRFLFLGHPLLSEEDKRTRVMVSHLKAMPVQVAKPLAEVALRDRTKFQFSGSANQSSSSRDLPPITRQFVEEYGRVEHVCTDSWIDVKDLKPSSLFRGFYVIGHSFLGGDEGVEVLIRADDERIYELDGFEKTETQRLANSWPSVYHWVLFHDDTFPAE